MANQPPNDNQRSEENGVRVIWASTEDLPALYANQLIVSHSGETEFHLIFGHLSPPLPSHLTGRENKPDYVEVRPVAKIVISPNAMEKFLEAMTTNMEKFTEKEKKK